MNQDQGIRYFPILLFSSVMGFSGVTIAIRLIEKSFEWNHILSSIFLIVSTLLFLLNAGFLIYRLIRFPAEVKADFNHPIRMNFFAAISISLLLLAVPYFEISKGVSVVLWVSGTILQLGLTLTILTKLMWKSPFQISQFNPTWFIPIVGNIVVPLAGVFHMSSDINWIFFGAGLLFSIIYMTIFINRMFFHPPLPKKIIPTLFILLAPPSIGFLSYLKLAGNLDAFAHILYGIAFFIALLLVFQAKEFFTLPFSISWWALLFPSAAFTIATTHMFIETGNQFYQWVYSVLAIWLIFLVVYLSWKTIQLALKRKLCLKEE